MRWMLITVLLTASTALAQNSPAPIPAGHFYFGLDLGMVQPFGRSLERRQPMSAGFGWGLYTDYEAEAFLISAELAHGSFGNDDSYSNPLAFSVRAGPLLGRGRFAPYVSAGLSWLAYGLVGDDAASATGVSFEFGVLMFRDRRWLRLTPYLEYFKPLSAGSGSGAQYVSSLSWAAAGVRFQF